MAVAILFLLNHGLFLLSTDERNSLKSQNDRRIIMLVRDYFLFIIYFVQKDTFLFTLSISVLIHTTAKIN